MGTIGVSEFNEAARLMKSSARWEDNGDEKIEPTEIKGIDPTSPEGQALLEKIRVKAETLLVFPASKIDPQRTYERGPYPDKRVDPLKVIHPERIAQDLIRFIPIPSKSCQEKTFADQAIRTLREAGKALDIQVKTDDFLARVSQLTPEEQKGFSCNSGSTSPNVGNIVATIPGDPALPVWNLSFHLDTKQLKFDPPIREGDTIRSVNGTPLGADDKAGLAITLEVLRALAEHKVPHGEIRIVGLVGEEETAGGAKLIAEEDIRGDVLVCIDGTNPVEVDRASPYLYKGYITIEATNRRTGKGGEDHPALGPHNGAVNACMVGAEFFVKAGFTPRLKPRGHESVVLTSPYSTCGVNGGQTNEKKLPVATPQDNIIPSFFTAPWQMRNLEGAEAAAQMAAGLSKTLETLCQGAETSETKLVCRITGTDKAGLPGYVVPASFAGVRLLEGGFLAVGKQPVVMNQQFGGFNGNFIHARFGETMLLLGTGAKLIHTNQEEVSVLGMATVAQGLLAAMIDSYTFRRVE